MSILLSDKKSDAKNTFYLNFFSLKFCCFSFSSCVKYFVKSVCIGKLLQYQAINQNVTNHPVLLKVKIRIYIYIYLWGTDYLKKPFIIEDDSSIWFCRHYFVKLILFMKIFIKKFLLNYQFTISCCFEIQKVCKLGREKGF